MFENKTILIVGVGEGIGKAITWAFTKGKARVFFVSRQKERGEKLLEQLRRINQTVYYLNADCSRQDGVLFVREQVEEKSKKLDILIINTGKWISKPLYEHSDEDWEQLINSNFKVHFLLYRNFASLFQRQKKGLIFSIVGIFGPRYVPNDQSVYNATKSACLSLSKSFAQELAPFNVKLFIISPTQTLHKIKSKKPWIKLETEYTLNRQAVPEDVALFIEKIASFPDIFSTGSVFEIAGIKSSAIF
ncbi:MAG: SDR family oxidoreductase [Planctomycetota bacterium]